MEMLNAMIPCPERIGMKAQKLPSGKWRVQILLGHDEEGKRIMKSITANSDDSLRSVQMEGRALLHQ